MSLILPIWARIASAALITALAAIPSCRQSKRKPAPKREDSRLVTVTGYCNCGKCCGWKRSWFGFGPPVYDYGKLKGKRKRVGITASGTRARHGTLAADPKLFPFGTKLVIPGYGTGVVEDVGGAIKGRHIDAWFPTHEEALRWGRKRLSVTELHRKKKPAAKKTSKKKKKRHSP